MQVRCAKSDQREEGPVRIITLVFELLITLVVSLRARLQHVLSNCFNGLAALGMHFPMYCVGARGELCRLETQGFGELRSSPCGRLLTAKVGCAEAIRTTAWTLCELGVRRQILPANSARVVSPYVK